MHGVERVAESGSEAPERFMPAPAAADPRTAFRTYVDSVVGTPEFRSALWGVLIVDPVRGVSLAELWSAHPEHGAAFERVAL